MAKGKRKTLPKDFAEQLSVKSVDELKTLFATTELTAYGDASKRCALAYPNCPDELTYWLVAQGLDVDTCDQFGWSPLAHRAGYHEANISILLDLGAKIDGIGAIGVPLIHAVAMLNLDHVKLLIERGADPLKPSCIGGHNALEAAVNNCDHYHISQAMPIVEYLYSLTRASMGWRKLLGVKGERVYPITDEIHNLVKKHGRSLETIRFQLAQNSNAAKDDDASFTQFDNAVQRLYFLFGVPPVAVIPVFKKYDGVSRIEVTGADIPAQYVQLWNMLVPRSGPAATVQGEVVRIVGRLRDEVEGNGGINWNSDFRAMQDALQNWLASGTPIDPGLTKAVREVIHASRHGGGLDCDFSVLDKAAVTWVQLNPDPIPLPSPTYRR